MVGVRRRHPNRSIQVRQRIVGRIGFGALKNDAALAAVTGMLGEVLTANDTRVRVAS